MAEIEFWYEFGSTYSYPAAMRIERLAADARVAVRWRPFLLGPILKQQGMNDSPSTFLRLRGAICGAILRAFAELKASSSRLPAKWT
jgi:DSBA-like thioredoxin domain